MKWRWSASALTNPAFGRRSNVPSDSHEARCPSRRKSRNPSCSSGVDVAWPGEELFGLEVNAFHFGEALQFLRRQDDGFRYEQDDGFRYELVTGELRRLTPAGFDHGVIVMNIAAPLAQHVKAKRLGAVCGAETGFTLATNPDTVLAPGVAFVRLSRMPSSGRPAGFWPGPPDLAVEVLSPNATTSGVDEKVERWLAAGTAAVWVVDARRGAVTIHRGGTSTRTLSDEDTLDGEDVVPGFRLPVADIFAT